MVSEAFRVRTSENFIKLCDHNPFKFNLSGLNYINSLTIQIDPVMLSYPVIFINDELMEKRGILFIRNTVIYQGHSPYGPNKQHESHEFRVRIVETDGLIFRGWLEIPLMHSIKRIFGFETIPSKIFKTHQKEQSLEIKMDEVDPKGQKKLMQELASRWETLITS